VFGRGSGNYSVNKMLQNKNIDANEDQVTAITNQIKGAGLILKNDQIIDEVLAA